MSIISVKVIEMKTTKKKKTQKTTKKKVTNRKAYILTFESRCYSNFYFEYEHFRTFKLGLKRFKELEKRLMEQDTHTSFDSDVWESERRAKLKVERDEKTKHLVELKEVFFEENRQEDEE